MRILFLCSVIEEFLSLVACRLQELEPALQCSAIVLGKHEYLNAVNSGAKWEHLAIFSDYLRTRLSSQPDLEFLRELENEYGMPNLYLFAAGDRHVNNKPLSHLLSMLEASFRFLLETWEQVNPEVVISEGIDCLQTYPLYAIARRRGVPFILPATGRLAGRIAFIRNHLDRWEKTEQIFERYKKDGLPPKNRQPAENFLNKYRAEHLKPNYVRTLSKPSLTPSSLGDLITYSRRYWEDPHNYVLTSPRQMVIQRLTRVTRRLIADNLFFEQPDPKDEFVLFPLHYQPEATTLVLSAFNTDQLSLMEYISKSLPVGCRLYVKEHPKSVGRRPLAYYRRLKSIPQVKLISPYIDSHNLIPKAAAIATISGTMGWEGILYEKPVVTFGRAFYNASGLTHPVPDLYDLPSIFQKAIFHWKSNPELLLKFIAAVLEGTYAGDLGYKNATAEAKSQQNIHTVASALLCELNDIFTERNLNFSGQHPPGRR